MFRTQNWEMPTLAVQCVPDHLARWEATWQIDGLAARIEVRAGPRLRRSLGRCQPAQGLIRLAPAVLEGPHSFFEEVLCHEAAHVGVFLLHGSCAKPHGRQWRQLMEQAGYAPRTRIPEASLPDSVRRASQPAVHYLHRCRVCHASRTARRPVRQWRCAACVAAGLDGRIEIVSRPVGARVAPL